MNREELADIIQIDAATTLEFPFRDALLNVYKKLPAEVGTLRWNALACGFSPMRLAQFASIGHSHPTPPMDQQVSGRLSWSSRTYS